MNKLHRDRQPIAQPRAPHAQARRFTPRAAVAAERTSSAGAISQFDPEKSQRSLATAPAQSAAPAPPPRAAAARRNDARRWPPAPIWLGVVAVMIGAGAWGASRFAGNAASETVVASASAAPVPAARVPAPPPVGQPVPAAPVVAKPAAPVRAVRPVAVSRPAASRPTAPARRATSPIPAPAPSRPVKPAPTVEAPTESGFRGSLTIDSDPPGARVLLNGRPVGVTPLALHDLPAGSRVVRVEADGYQPWSAAVRVVADQGTQVTATLRR